MLGWLMHLLIRKPSRQVLEDAQRYRRSLHMAGEAIPDDPRLRRVIREFDRAEERLRGDG